MKVVPQELSKLKQWVNTNDDSKCPRIGYDYTSVSDSTKWLSFEEALANVEKGINDYVGFVFNNNNIVGIDIDTGFDEDGLISDLALDILLKCKSFTEFSKSGRGFHVYLRGTLPFNGSNNRNGVEIYQVGRYFIFTGNEFYYDKLIDNQEAINYVIEKYFNYTKNEKSVHNNRMTIYRPITEFKNGKIVTTYPPIEKGCRNICLTSLAGQLHNKGADYMTIYNKIIEVNETACTPPLSKDEVETIVDSVTRYER